MSTATKRVRALRNKTTANANPETANKVASSATKVQTIVTPLGGFRKASIRDRAIFAAISANPGLTTTELSIVSGYYVVSINDALYYTKEGRKIASKGLVAKSDRGTNPRWFESLSSDERKEVKVRRSENYLPSLVLGKEVRKDTRNEWTSRSALISNALFRRTASPTILKTVAQEINAILLVSAIKQDTTERRNKSLSTRLANAKSTIEDIRAEKKLLLSVQKS